MLPQDWINAFAGGVIIGIAVSIMLVFNGRVTGISGILGNAFTAGRGERQWRWFFLSGLLLGGTALYILNPHLFTAPPDSVSNLRLILAGLFVGFGTLLGSGCTSGHGICGISRMSTRSILATIIFITAGVLAVSLSQQLGGF